MVANSVCSIVAVVDTVVGTILASVVAVVPIDFVSDSRDTNLHGIGFNTVCRSGVLGSRFDRAIGLVKRQSLC
jgi:hypothetical protein